MAGAERQPSAADVRIENVTKRFDGVVAVDDLSLEIERGLLLRPARPVGLRQDDHAAHDRGLRGPDLREVFLGDRDVVGLPPYRRDVNTVFQSYALFPHLTIAENVAFGLRRRGVRGRRLRGQVASVLERVGLEGFEKRKPRQLSGGQQQRVALARALVNSPRVLLLDEPLGALDLKLRKQMQLELKAIQHDVGITFVHVTHDQEEAMTMADTIAVMQGGRIEQLGTPNELYEEPQTAFVAGFLGVSNLLRGTVAGDDHGTARGRRRGDRVGGRRSGRAGQGRRRHPPREDPARPLRHERVRGPVAGGRLRRRLHAVHRPDQRRARDVYVQNTQPGAAAVAPGTP